MRPLVVVQDAKVLIWVVRGTKAPDSMGPGRAEVSLAVMQRRTIPWGFRGGCDIPPGKVRAVLKDHESGTTAHTLCSLLLQLAPYIEDKSDPLHIFHNFFAEP
jgi:hypothetical protein